MKKVKMDSQFSCTQSISPCMNSGTVSVKKIFTLSTKSLIPCVIFSHTSPIFFLASSLVAMKVTRAVITAAIIVTRRIIGLAFIAAFKSHCAIVAPSFAALNALKAFTTDMMVLATLNATNPAAIPARPAITASELSIIH